jgi:putative addiction module component (TIGR02574 family)
MSDSMRQESERPPMTLELEQLRKLPVVDKLRIVEQLWDDIGESDEPLPLSDWVIDESKRRAAELAASPEIGLTREELWKRVDQNDS